MVNNNIPADECFDNGTVTMAQDCADCANYGQTDDGKPWCAKFMQLID